MNTPVETTSLDEAWRKAEEALLNRRGGSPYLDVTCDLMAWCVARASNAQGHWNAEGDTPAAALLALAAALNDQETPLSRAATPREALLRVHAPAISPDEPVMVRWADGFLAALRAEGYELVDRDSLAAAIEAADAHEWDLGRRYEMGRRHPRRSPRHPNASRGAASGIAPRCIRSEGGKGQ